MLVRPDSTPQKAKYPVIDAHNHLFGDVDPEEMVKIMDEVGIRIFNNVTGNTKFSFVEKGYSATYRSIDFFLEHYAQRYPERFICFTMSVFAHLDNDVLIKDKSFTDRAVRRLDEDVAKGARGLKVTKELGLRFKDQSGMIVPVDDERIFPLWERAGELGVPVLIHTSDPAAFFLPADEHNEHSLWLSWAPDWGFHGSFYSKEELLEQRDRMIAMHPETTFICAHVANYPESLDYVSEFLETHPNAYVDISARMDELGRQPYTARDFLIKYQDRVLFGTDMPVKADVYRSYFRFLETSDEYFEHPDYIGRFGNSRWMVYGLYLPDRVLRKIYYENACKIIPGIKL
jgi:predicted TIM-barrel fold metal-dependent hydrolase